jgi:hypothetical protein
MTNLITNHQVKKGKCDPLVGQIADAQLQNAPIRESLQTLLFYFFHKLRRNHLICDFQFNADTNVTLISVVYQEKKSIVIL